MKVTIEFEMDASLSEDVFLVLSRAHTKIMNQLQRLPGCICTAPEADDQLRDFNGNVVGSVTVECGYEADFDCTARNPVDPDWADSLSSRGDREDFHADG